MKIQKCSLSLVLAVVCLLAHSKGEDPSVSLTVEGEVDLVGDVCPGIVTFVCSGVDLTILRWRYNESINIKTYPTDSTPSMSNLSGPTFLSVELLSLSQNSSTSNIANFSSKLTVNVSGLHSEAITSIVCGDPKTFKVFTVDVVNVIQEREPETPDGVTVTSVYEYGSLMNVIVSWKKQQTLCQKFLRSLRYHVMLLGFSDTVVNASSCGQVCTTTFRNFPNVSIVKEYTLSLYAVNSLGSSDTFQYPFSIMQQSQSYFIPMVVSTECAFTGECFTNESLVTSDCNVSYTIDSSYMNMESTTLVSPLNTQFEINGLSSDAFYYFEFTVSVNKTLLVRNRISEKTMSGQRLSVSSIVFISLFIVGGLFLLLCITLICLWESSKEHLTKIISVACVLGAIGFILFLVFFIVTFAQKDTCSLDWSRARDTLIILAFILISAGYIFLLLISIAICIQGHDINCNKETTYNVDLNNRPQILPDPSKICNVDQKSEENVENSSTDSKQTEEPLPSEQDSQSHALDNESVTSNNVSFNETSAITKANFTTEKD